MNRLSDKAKEIVLGTEFLDYDPEYVSLVDVVCKLAAYEDTGLEPEEVAKLARVKDDGRLVVLPCKVGDYVYDICNGTPYQTRVLQFVMFQDGHVACRTVSSFPNVDQFGERIFLTLEEAEKALEGVE